MFKTLLLIFCWNIIVIITIRTENTTLPEGDKVVAYLESVAKNLTLDPDLPENYQDNNYRILVLDHLDKDYILDGHVIDPTKSVSKANQTRKQNVDNKKNENPKVDPDKINYKNDTIENNGTLITYFIRAKKNNESLLEKKKRLERIREQKIKEQMEYCTKKRVEYIIAFLRDKPLSTKFVHYEVNRMKKTNKIRDRFRRYVFLMEYLHPKFATDNNVQTDIVKCFKEQYSYFAPTIYNHHSFLSIKPNNLIIDIFNDSPKKK